MVTLYTVTLTIVCCVAVGVAIIAERRRGGDQQSWLTLSNFAVLAACCATLSTLAYALAGDEADKLIPLVIGDISMPLAVGLLAAGVRRAAGRRHHATVFLIVSVGVGLTTLVVSAEAGQAVKLVTLAAFCAATVWTCARGPLPALGARLIGITCGIYGVYALARLVGPLLLGPDAPEVQLYLSSGPSSLVSALAVGVTAVGTVMLIRSESGIDEKDTVNADTLADWVDALLQQRGEVSALSVTVPDLALHRTAFGRAWAHSVSSALSRATTASMPTGSVVGEVTAGVLVSLRFGSGADTDAIRERLQTAYERMLPPAGPTDPPEVKIEVLDITESADLRRFARAARTTARRAASFEGM
ncbi:hypothetical protein CVS47_00479 [Microbacterium lemovicicum]|uniref:Uncharacterized protein n=1 Tax=Microbacterium lemovicicum TaxID=1072463 RepID=A0A3S9W723_9MICO|nr:hypothetical protein [Microbacterium lemovicicum]AZS35881.1 hypothetical protein CVS47_00479 [Microbacterium lemovicicum]